jgi:type IV secretory pathway VirB10-like protein
VRYHLPIKNLFCSLLCFGLLSLTGVAFAQVYKSYDADGNVVFSDKPTKRSKEVEITKPNLSDSFEAPPSPPAESSHETKPEAESEPAPITQPIADDDSADTNNDGRISRREKEEQRKKKRKKAKAAEGYKE